MALPPTTAWSALHNSQLTVDDVQQVLSKVHDDLWVVSACVDRILDDTATQHALLTLGVSRTDGAVMRCKDIIALAFPSQDSLHALISHFQNAPTDALLCYSRSVLLRRLDRLNTYIEIEGNFPGRNAIEMDDVIEEWEDDPWADGEATSSSKPAPQVNSAEPPPISLSEFLQNDLLWSACELASLEALEAVRILLLKHSMELWPRRFKVQECIPEHIHPSLCRGLFPAFDLSSNREAIPSMEPCRSEPDFSELANTQEAIKSSLSQCPTITDSDKRIDCTCFADRLTAEAVSSWYKNRVNLVVSSTGMIDLALALVQDGASQGIPSLDELGEELSLLSRLVYDAAQGKDIEDDWTLARWYSMDPIAVVRAYVAHSSSQSIAHDISHLVMPYLFVLEARAERAGTPDPSLPTRILYEYILASSLESAAVIFDASKPTLPSSQRIIRNDEDMVRVALACLYGSDSLTDWPTMSSIFECLPVWDVPKDEDGDEEAADTTITSLGAFVTPSTNQPQCTAQDLLLFFQALPLASLSRALDILDVHLESGEILSRWSVPAPLRWFLQSSGEPKEQRAWANRMARRAGGQDDKLNGIEDWEWLLEDMRKLTGNGDPAARGAFCLLSREEIDGIFLTGLLSTGNFAVAKSMVYGPRPKLDLSPDIVESVCLACSREFYDNASSGNYKFGDMKLAYDCLDVPPSSNKIIMEKEFIEATSRICSFNVPSKPGFTLSPIEIRLTKDRLSLVSRVISSNNDTYKHTQVILDLSDKLGYRNDAVAEVKILAMIADTALQAEDFTRAYENSERMVQTVTAIRKAGINEERIREASEVCWIACFQLGRQQEFADLPKKMTLLGHALEFCPADKIHDVLTAWRKLESEDINSRQQKLQQRLHGETTNTVPRQLGTMPSNVASSLRARLQDFHMPSPPLLSTPDAAALASRTFKSVTANFPFAVGHRGRSQHSDVDEVASLRSESSRRTDGEDVSSQASRVLSKGIGWLIGADGEL
ncbi:hypothetical protein GALMADRAFT_218426 [Galerina marginata CBS 339.88]|uniref:Sec39 domain-containing protein n=1 Tax=Galerina marginata (strain CBS 339.88) TaxID=685588 RepID=A0A067U1U5_GALM3|nr:hypothetical protein GALMADRAFT_218426 [Galerina marginata CBS 339.88]